MAAIPISSHLATDPQAVGFGGALPHALTGIRDAQAPRAGNGDTHGHTADAISRAIAGLLRRRTGRGATKARAALSGDLALVTLVNALTAVEKTLAGEGHATLARQVRTALLDGMQAEAVAAVETITGGQVAAYLTSHRHNPDRTIIAFVFAPPAHLEVFQ